jgi:hypothetical protein
MAKQKLSGAKQLSQAMAAHFEQIQNFPVKVAEGFDQCTGKVHEARFLRGFVGDARELWVQAREVLGMGGMDPISNYEVVSMGLGDNLTPAVWAELHSLNSRKLTIRMLSQASVQDSWRAADKADTPKEFVSLQELKVAMAALEGAIQRVTPWNAAFKTLSIFLTVNNFGESELAGRPTRVSVIVNFIDEVLRANARNWEEKKPFESAQELGVRWQAAMVRQGSFSGAVSTESKRRERTESVAKTQLRQLCRKFNEGRCPVKDGRHPAPYDSSITLRHACNKYLADKKRLCMEDHAAPDHK